MEDKQTLDSEPDCGREPVPVFLVYLNKAMIERLSALSAARCIVMFQSS